MFHFHYSQRRRHRPERVVVAWSLSTRFRRSSFENNGRVETERRAESIVRLFNGTGIRIALLNSGVVLVGDRGIRYTTGGINFRGCDERVLRRLRASSRPLERRIFTGRPLLGADDRSLSQRHRSGVRYSQSRSIARSNAR